VFCLWSVVVSAGTKDLSRKYPIKIKINGVETGGIVDSGGTSLSIEDAKKSGLLGANGDPTGTPENVSIGGAGGASVTAYKFSNVSIGITPSKSDGTTNGDSRSVTASVVVPQKPANQDGANDTAKQNKTNSLTTKLGVNVTGADFNGGR
jgi:hypothetical protein